MHRPATSTDAHTEIAEGSGRYGPLFDEIRHDLDELTSVGRLQRAADLSSRTDNDFHGAAYPQYFVGDLDAQFVLVHLNPKGSTVVPTQLSGPVPSFEEYYHANRHFGANKYGPASSRTHRSPFDLKQIRFMRPFEVIDFVEERTRADRFTNLERVIDDKLQLELIPYPSPTFHTRGFTEELLTPHYERIMRVIAACPREYVIFCGAVFEPLLSRYIVDDYRFRLTKNDGLPEAMTSRFARLRLDFDGQAIHGGLAQSWARQGIPMASYAAEIRCRY